MNPRKRHARLERHRRRRRRKANNVARMIDRNLSALAAGQPLALRRAARQEARHKAALANTVTSHPANVGQLLRLILGGRY